MCNQALLQEYRGFWDVDKMTNMASMYKYTPLEETDIRVVHLCPGDRSDDLRLSISHTALTPLKVEDTADNKGVEPLPKGWRALRTSEGRRFYRRPNFSITYDRPTSRQEESSSADCLVSYRDPNSKDGAHPASPRDFEALSYAWGLPDRSHMANVVDSASNQSLGDLKITHSLDIALRGLRKNDIKRTLWIDAISINQDDLVERNVQVLRMGDIYRQASRVVVWLGCELENTLLAMTALQSLGQIFELSDDGWWYRAPDFDDLEPGLDQPVPFSKEQWDAIQDLLFMPWFRRLWVLQEITLGGPGSILQCGQHQITYHDLRRALAGLVERSGVPNDLSYIINDKNDLVYGLNQTSLKEVLSTSRQHLCSDPRDKVYGMLGLLGPKFREGIQPSYYSSCQEVYKEVFQLHSNNTARLDLLSQCYFVGSEDMPSWLPDWRAHPKLFRRPDLGWQASGMSKADFRVVQSRLECTGLVLDTVLETHEPAEEGDRNSFLSKLKEIQPADLHAKYLKTAETLLDAWVSTLTIGAYQEKTVSAGYEPFATWKEKLLHVLGMDSKSADLASEVEGLGNSNIDNLECMKYFKTQQGYIGLGPVARERNDRICVLLGAFTPLVIRAAGNSSYQLIGWCYVHGLMDSEALLGPLPEPWTVEQHFLGRRQTPVYRNSIRHTQREDPRLDALSDQWQRIPILELALTTDDPVAVDFFRNMKTGSIVNHDPRMTKEALEARGVRFECVRFV